MIHNDQSRRVGAVELDTKSEISLDGIIWHKKGLRVDGETELLAM